MKIINKQRFTTTLIILLIIFSLYIAVGTIEKRTEEQIKKAAIVMIGN